MRVRIKTWASAAVGAAALSAIAGTAAAQCGSTCQPPPPPPTHPCCTLPPPPTYPPVHPGGGGDGGGGGGGGGYGGGRGGGDVNVNVNVRNNVNSSSNANAEARSSLNARSGSAGSGRSYGNIGGGAGGSAFVSVEQPYPTAINGLNVESAAVAQVIQVPYEEWRRFEKRVVIQAVCIDDRNIPHPASQVRPDREVSGDYEGELYRCIAGSRLQVTIAEYLDRVSFDGGDILACEKGEALWHGRGGIVECRTQKRERDCNERSLLRRYGAGIKILTIIREEKFMAYREEVVQAAGVSVINSSIVLDGGVGGRVF